MIRADSMSTMSGDDTGMETVEGSIIWSQDDAFSSSEIWQLQPEPESNSFSPLCRLCAGLAENPVYIYSEIGESMKLDHKINTCLSVKVVHSQKLGLRKK